MATSWAMESLGSRRTGRPPVSCRPTRRCGLGPCGASAAGQDIPVAAGDTAPGRGGHGADRGHDIQAIRACERHDDRRLRRSLVTTDDVREHELAASDP